MQILRKGCGGWGYGSTSSTDESGTMLVSSGIEEQIDPQLMVPNLQSSDRIGVIKELVDRMHQAGWVDDSLSFLQSVLVREDIESTVVSEGVAFPHARSYAVKRLGAAFGVSREGVCFGDQGEPVHVVCLLGVPSRNSADYLPLLARVSQTFDDRAFQAHLLECPTSEHMYRTIRAAL
jgi:mannitol/fructose-specific phosphotransferase system IIA component (Ntr-type)